MNSAEDGPLLKWQILDEPVCLRAWKRLHGLGLGLGVKCGKYLVKLVGYIVCILDCLECVSKENHLSAHSTQ